MEKAIDLTNQIIKNLESLNNDYLKTIENYENTVANNTKEIAHLEEEKERIAKDLILYQEELEKVNKEYQDVEVHISGIKEAGTNLLEANSVEKMLEEARLKKEEIASQITIKEEKAQEEDKEVEAKKVDLVNQLESLNNLLPYLKENYSDKLNAFEETLNKLNQEIIDLQKEYQDEALKEVKTEEKETVVEAAIEEVQAEEIVESEITEPEVIEEPVVEEPVVEEKELSDEAQEVEQIKEEIETLDVSAEPQVESLDEEAEVPVLTDNKEEADKVYIEPRIDYSMNPYTKIDQLGLSEQQKSRIVREMSPEKFVQITRVLEDYEIDLKDIADYYDDFLKIEKAANLEDVLGTLRGIGKSNEEQDFSSQLDFIMKANGSVLQDNLLKVYSKGENPKDINISALTSEYYYDFDQEAENLGLDAKTMRKTHPVLVNIMPLEKVVEKTKEDSMTKELVR